MAKLFDNNSIERIQRSVTYTERNAPNQVPQRRGRLWTSTPGEAGELLYGWDDSTHPDVSIQESDNRAQLQWMGTLGTPELGISTGGGGAVLAEVTKSGTYWFNVSLECERDTGNPGHWASITFDSRVYDSQQVEDRTPFRAEKTLPEFTDNSVRPFEHVSLSWGMALTTGEFFDLGAEVVNEESGEDVDIKAIQRTTLVLVLEHT